MKTFISIALPNFSLLTVMFKKPLLLFVTIPVVVEARLVVDFESVCYFLLIMFLVDLLTGLLGSYFEWRASDHAEKWFFGKGEGFSSDKAKKMGVKALVYAGVPYMFVEIQRILFLKNFKYARLSEAEFELATIAVIVFCLIEGFSIFHENLPKCGFNLWERIKKILGFYKQIKKELSE